MEADDGGEREQRKRAGLHPRQPLAERDVGEERAGRGGHEQHRQRFRPRERETNRHAHEADQRDRRADGSQADGRCRPAQHQHAGFHHRHGGQCQRKGERVQSRRDLILRANEVQPPRREERERGQSDEHQERGPALLSNRFFAPTGVIPRQPAERGGTGDHEAQEREPRGGRRGREQLRARRADDGQRQQPAAVDGTGQVFGADQVAPAGAHHAHERRHRREFHRDIERALRALRERVGEEQERERGEEQRDDEHPAAGAGELPPVQRVLAGTEQGERDRGREHEPEIRDRFERLPQGDNKGD